MNVMLRLGHASWACVTLGVGAIPTASTDASLPRCFIAFSLLDLETDKQVLCRCSNSWNFSGLATPRSSSCDARADEVTTAPKSGDWPPERKADWRRGSAGAG